MSQASEAAQAQRMERYYRVHARVYDATRWSFLFGRQQIVDLAARHCPRPRAVLEVGCGTGVNLLRLLRAFPAADVVGLDVAAPMLRVARKNLAGQPRRVQLLQAAYDQPLFAQPRFDLIVCSYSLSMINPGWEQVLDNMRADLVPGGFVACVDFHDSDVAPFARWMGANHVRMDGHLLPGLTSRFQPQVSRVSRAYGNLWRYMLFVGQK